VLAFQAGAEIAGWLDDKAAQQKCSESLARLRAYTPPHGNSKQAAALMALAGVGEAAALNREVMAVDGSKRLSTFYGYYVLQARAKAGDYQGCLEAIRQFWGGMLDLGATTFWEDFDLDWLTNAAPIDALVPAGKKDIHGDFGAYCYKGFRHSLCHGWASGPTAWLSEHVLGVQVIEPPQPVERDGEEQDVKRRMSRLVRPVLPPGHRRGDARGQCRRPMAQAPHQAQHRQGQEAHASPLVPVEQLQAQGRERQIGHVEADAEHAHDGQAQDPVQDDGRAAVARLRSRRGQRLGPGGCAMGTRIEMGRYHFVSFAAMAAWVGMMETGLDSEKTVY